MAALLHGSEAAAAVNGTAVTWLTYATGTPQWKRAAGSKAAASTRKATSVGSKHNKQPPHRRRSSSGSGVQTQLAQGLLGVNVGKSSGGHKAAPRRSITSQEQPAPRYRSRTTSDSTARPRRPMLSVVVVDAGLPPPLVTPTQPPSARRSAAMASGTVLPGLLSARSPSAEQQFWKQPHHARRVSHVPVVHKEPRKAKAAMRLSHSEVGSSVRTPDVQLLANGVGGVASAMPAQQRRPPRASAGAADSGGRDAHGSTADGRAYAMKQLRRLAEPPQVTVQGLGGLPRSAADYASRMALPQRPAPMVATYAGQPRSRQAVAETGSGPQGIQATGQVVQPALAAAPAAKSEAVRSAESVRNPQSRRSTVPSVTSTAPLVHSNTSSVRHRASEGNVLAQHNNILQEAAKLKGFLHATANEPRTRSPHANTAAGGGTVARSSRPSGRPTVRPWHSKPRPRIGRLKKRLGGGSRRCSPIDHLLTPRDRVFDKAFSDKEMVVRPWSAGSDRSFDQVQPLAGGVPEYPLPPSPFSESASSVSSHGDDSSGEGSTSSSRSRSSDHNAQSPDIPEVFFDLADPAAVEHWRSRPIEDAQDPDVEAVTWHEPEAAAAPAAAECEPADSGTKRPVDVSEWPSLSSATANRPLSQQFQRRPPSSARSAHKPSRRGHSSSATRRCPSPIVARPAVLVRTGSSPPTVHTSPNILRPTAISLQSPGSAHTPKSVQSHITASPLPQPTQRVSAITPRQTHATEASQTTSLSEAARLHVQGPKAASFSPQPPSAGQKHDRLDNPLLRRRAVGRRHKPGS